MNRADKEEMAVDEARLQEGCQALIQAPGTAGQEQEAAAVLLELMKEAGFDRVWSDGVGNVIGEIKGAFPGAKVLFDAQLDTIPVSGSDQWKMDPYDGDVKEGRLYGRGAVGMKGALAAMVYGLAPLAAGKEKLAGTFYVSGSVGGEIFPGLGFSQVVHVVKPDVVVLGAPSDLQLAHGQRGRAEVSIATYGRAVHSACAEQGNNAVAAMQKLIGEMENIVTPRHRILGKGALCLTNIISAPYPAVGTVPHKCWATFDRYLLPGEGEQEALGPIHQVIATLQAEDETFRAEAELAQEGLECYTGQYLGSKRCFAAWLNEADGPFFSGAVAALAEAGIKAKPVVYPMATNGSYCAGILQLPTLGFGPGRPEDLHVVDEAVTLADLFSAARGYQALARHFLKKTAGGEK
ncbi:YgeY family selenium metabolism-linked hydrolase [Azotosporobacter soli]|uniref:YgeY family selenium metabolism-linked hydrolase n=1 Tax=Azotosporobacter soli TaxID=3055040 RepID=UPI0031FE7E6C